MIQEVNRIKESYEASKEELVLQLKENNTNILTSIDEQRK